jgi:hypothetical protein
VGLLKSVLDYLGFYVLQLGMAKGKRLGEGDVGCRNGDGAVLDERERHIASNNESSV